MKKLRKLTIKKITLRDLDQPSLDRVIGGVKTETVCNQTECGTCNTLRMSICVTICATNCGGPNGTC